MHRQLTIFTKEDLKALIVPLLFDQVLNVCVGMEDTVMVSTVGEAAVSGVSLVDTRNMFFLMIFAGLATGGSIICAQMIGTGKYRQARMVANQLLLITGGIAVLFLTGSLLFRDELLNLIFGKVERDVMTNAGSYFFFVACSLPFLAIYNGCAALFRAMDDSKTPMKISIVMNGINLVGNACCDSYLSSQVFVSTGFLYDQTNSFHGGTKQFGIRHFSDWENISTGVDFFTGNGCHYGKCGR